MRPLNLVWVLGLGFLVLCLCWPALDRRHDPPPPGPPPTPTKGDGLLSVAGLRPGMLKTQVDELGQCTPIKKFGPLLFTGKDKNKALVQFEKDRVLTTWGSGLRRGETTLVVSTAGPEEVLAKLGKPARVIDVRTRAGRLQHFEVWFYPDFDLEVGRNWTKRRFGFRLGQTALYPPAMWKVSELPGPTLSGSPPADPEPSPTGRG